jgi:hypothetical protein
MERAALFHQPGDWLAVKAPAIVNRDHPRTLTAVESCILYFGNPDNPVLLNERQILLCAHSEVSSVSPVHPVDLLTGVLATFEAESGFSP